MKWRFAVPWLLLPVAAAAQLTPEHQLALTSLRSGEKERLEKALGAHEEQPFYRAAFDVDPEARKVNGTVVISYFAKERPLPYVYLRVTPNADRPQAVKLLHATVNGTPTLIEQPEPTLYRVKLDPVALPGTGATIELRVQAKVPEAPHNSDSMEADPGLLHAQKAEYGAFLAAPEVMSLNGLLPGVVPLKADGTPFAGPAGMGDLASYEPAHYMVSIEVPGTHEVVCAGNALGVVPRPDGRVRYSFGLSAARDFPIFVTRGYEKSTQEVDGVVVESHYLASDSEAGHRVGSYAASALAEFQKRFGPYPWHTFRVVEARLIGGAGGMEFPGLVSVSTGLYRGAANPLAALGLGGSLAQLGPLKDMLHGLDQMMETTLEFTVAHEVAHQWFAMMVGSDPIAEPFADEPLTQHAALLYLEWKHGKRAAEAMRDAQLKMAFQFFRATGGHDGTCERATSDFETTGEYAALIYGKCPLLFDAVRKQLGDSAYLKALRGYADENRWKWVSADTLFRALGPKKVEKLRKRWWQEAKGDEDLGKSQVAEMLQGMQGLQGSGLPGAQGSAPGGAHGGAGAGAGASPGAMDLTQQLSQEQLKQLEELVRILNGGEP